LVSRVGGDRFLGKQGGSGIDMTTMGSASRDNVKAVLQGGERGVWKTEENQHLSEERMGPKC